MSETTNTSDATNTEDSKYVKFTSKFLNKDTLTTLISFLGMYVVLYIVLGIFFKISSPESHNTLIAATNIITIAGVFFFCFKVYYDLNEEQKSKPIITAYNYAKESMTSVENILTFGVYLLFLVGVLSVLHLPTPDGRSSFVLDILHFSLWCVLLLNILIVFVTNVLNIPIIRIIEEALFGKVSEQEPVEDSDETGETKEVFNISNNIYTYDEAPHVCKALGARLASYDEIETAYNKGGEWCNYGWTENQMAYFPTQKDTWQKLQSNTSMKNSCGRPGINGGYMPNPKMRYGVNCYGVKPDASELDTERMQTSRITPRTHDDVKYERKIAFWKENAARMLNLNPHNRSDWSSYS